MGKYKKLKVISSMPFFIIGTLFIIGAIWLAVDRLMEGLVWYESDGFIIGWLIVLLIFGLPLLLLEGIFS